MLWTYFTLELRQFFDKKQLWIEALGVQLQLPNHQALSEESHLGWCLSGFLSAGVHLLHKSGFFNQLQTKHGSQKSAISRS